MNTEQEIALIIRAADELQTAAENGDPDRSIQISKMYLAQQAAVLYRAANVLEEVTAALIRES